MLNNILLISKYTFKEALSKKIFITFFGISTFVLLITGLILFNTDLTSFSGIQVNGKQIEPILEQVLAFIKNMITMPLYAGGLFLSIFSAAGFIPQMLEKGNIEFLLSKPVSRKEIILGKYLGGISIVFANIGFLVSILWILLGVRFSVWDPYFLLAIPIITFVFALLYSLMIFIGIQTKSSILAMMLSYIIFFIASPILSRREFITNFIGSDVIRYIGDGLHFIIPQTSELGGMLSDVVNGTQIDDFTPLIISCGLIILIIFGSITSFDKKDY